MTRQSVYPLTSNPESSPATLIEIERERWRPTLRYLSQTEVHVYALAIAASVLLSFFPFLIVMLTLVRDVLHLPAAERALMMALRDYFPGDLGDFIVQKLRNVHHGRFQVTSLVVLLFTANGVFEPLEVALNRAWGVKENRSYVANQLFSFFLILLCGGLALSSVLLTAVNTSFITTEYGLKAAWVPLLVFKLAAIPVTILSLLLTYWLLPNRRVPLRRVLPVAFLVGLALELWKYVFLFAWPWLDKKFQNEYGPFNYAVAIVVFSLLTSFLVLAGAEWSARSRENDDLILAVQAAGV
jgi:membrane protein